MSKDRFENWLSQGGQKQARRAGAADVHEVKGPDRERQTYVDYKAAVTGVMDPRLNLTPQQRAIGNCYGAYFEQAHTGGSTEFLREFVDGGGLGGGGYTERQAHICAMVIAGQAALGKMKAVRYQAPKSRKAKKNKGAAKPGRFLPIPALTLIDAVCVHGHTVEAVAIRFQWFMLEKTKARQPWDQAKLVTQWRPRRAISDAISERLDALGDAWHEAGFTVPYQFGNVEVE